MVHSFGIRPGLFDEHHSFGLVLVEKLRGEGLARRVTGWMNLDEGRVRTVFETLWVKHRNPRRLDTGDDRVEVGLVTDVHCASAHAEVENPAERGRPQRAIGFPSRQAKAAAGAGHNQDGIALSDVLQQGPSRLIDKRFATLYIASGLI